MNGDGGLVIVIGSRAYAAPPYLAGLAARRAGVHGVRIVSRPEPGHGFDDWPGAVLAGETAG